MLNDLAERDGLTGLYNRRRYDKDVEKLWRQSRRDQSQLTLLLVDIDHFKGFNDRHGHLEGDNALMAVVDVLRSTLRQTDILCRWGGEEFAVILPHVSAFESCRVANNLRKRVAETVIVCGDPVTISCGIAVHRPDETPGALFARADAALYRAKAEGRNRIACSHDCPGADVPLAA
jgi:diguanylate cyclase (GGDEF)-like protein